jgi:hypothetical protein
MAQGCDRTTFIRRSNAMGTLLGFPCAVFADLLPPSAQAMFLQDSGLLERIYAPSLLPVGSGCRGPAATGKVKPYAMSQSLPHSVDKRTNVSVKAVKKRGDTFVPTRIHSPMTREDSLKEFGHCSRGTVKWRLLP